MSDTFFVFLSICVALAKIESNDKFDFSMGIYKIFATNFTDLVSSLAIFRFKSTSEKVVTKHI